VRPLVFGVLNVTPDSFSDGGRYLDPAAAIAHAVQLSADGADVIDVGGETTRPGAARTDAAEEAARVAPVIRELTARGIRTSVDTMRASTAAAALEAGASVVNDVSGGLADPDIVRVAVDTGAIFVAMHWRGHSDTMTTRAVYDDVVADVRRELGARVDALLLAGLDPDRLVLDPGLGFAKDAEHNWQLLGRMSELASLGHPLLIGASRKRFLGALLPEGAPVEQRDLGTAVVSALSAASGAWAVRVHDVRSTVAALDVAAAWRRGAESAR
jgi:dihydropteroate synthase